MLSTGCGASGGTSRIDVNMPGVLDLGPASLGELGTAAETKEAQIGTNFVLQSAGAGTTMSRNTVTSTSFRLSGGVSTQ